MSNDFDGGAAVWGLGLIITAIFVCIILLIIIAIKYIIYGK